MFEAQAEFIKRLIAGVLKVPSSQEAMKEEDKQFVGVDVTIAGCLMLKYFSTPLLSCSNTGRLRTVHSDGERATSLQ